MTDAFDLSVFETMNGAHTQFLDGLFGVITHLGDAGLLWIILAAALLLFRKTRPCGIALAVSLAVCLIFNNLLLKNLVARPRPYVKYDIVALVLRPSGTSFPSGHTASSFAAAFTLALTLWRPSPLGAGLSRKAAAPLASAVYLLAALIAFSRVWLRVHYCTDVLAGMLSGTLCAAAGVWLTLWLLGRISVRKKPAPPPA